MKRRGLITRAGLAGILAAGAAPAVHAQPAIRWRLASSFPKALDTLWGFTEILSQTVSDMSSGRFKISIHAGGELVPPFGVVDAVQTGSVDLTHTAPYYFTGKNMAFALASGIPFGFNARQMDSWMRYGNGHKLMSEFFSDYNMVYFDGGHTGTQMGGWYRKEIKGPEDLKGLKMRMGGGLTGEIMGRMGVVAQSIPASDIYPALEKGTIDAVEWIGPHDDRKLGLYKVAPNYYYPGWWEGDAFGAVLVNAKQYAALPDDLKAILAAACANASKDTLAKYDGVNPVALKQLVGSGAKLRPFPKSVLDLAFTTTMEVYAELEKSNPIWAKIYGDMRVYQRDQLLWARIAEQRYDQYLATQKL